MRIGKRLGIFAFLLLLVCMMPMGALAAKEGLNKKNVTLYVGQETRIKVKNASRKVEWSTNAPGKLDLKNGWIAARSRGKAKVRAKVGKKTYKCTVLIKQQVTSITLNQGSGRMAIGKWMKMNPTVLPVNADDQKIIWSSSDKSIAKVNKKGNVKALSKGTVTITATAADGFGATDSWEITVMTQEELEELERREAASQPSPRALQFLNILQEYSAQVAVDAAREGADKLLWVYDAYYGSEGVTWEIERANAQNRGGVNNQKIKKVVDPVTGQESTTVDQGAQIAYTNCALLLRWALKDPRLALLSPSESFWSKWEGGKAWFYFNGPLKKNLEHFYENFEVITVDKTPAQLEAEGNLLPGDICGWNGMQHTNVYAGNHTWYEGGRVSGGSYQTVMIGGKNKKDKYVFKTFGPVTGVGMIPSRGRTIHQIIRIK
ncbi:MAG: Ig-like domain-containing protein [Eubacteriales bacterium]|nr:Ig-like domain-containing protein [Eubacteriales bacterium]